MDRVCLDSFSVDVRCLQFGSDTCVQLVLRVPGNTSGDHSLFEGRMSECTHIEFPPHKLNILLFPFNKTAYQYIHNIAKVSSNNIGSYSEDNSEQEPLAFCCFTYR